MTFQVDNWVNVIAGLLSIVAILGGGITYLFERREKKHDAWVKRFLAVDLRGVNEKEKLLAKAYREYKSEKKVRAIFLEACNLSGRYDEGQAETHFQKLWNIVYHEVVNTKVKGV